MVRDGRHHGTVHHGLRRTARNRVRSASTVSIAGGVALAAICTPELLIPVVAVFLLLYLGVILPAVWSTRTARRRAASTVLHELLTALRQLVRGR
jgi:Flp pilus assembly protein TadB